MVENQAEGPYYRIEETKNVDLRNERLKATFDTEVLTQFMFGGEKAHFPINLRRQIARLAYSHPVHSTHLPLEYLDAEEFYTVLIRKSFIAIREAQRLNIDDNKILGWYLSTFTNGRFLFGLHTGMFMHTLETMASEEQQNKFLPLARSFRIIGTYAQTELGHGSNIQSLETEAVFDRKTDSFVLNSPKLTSIKFWPGALGRSTNFVLLMAQLYTPDRNSPCGLQMFFVQIRDLDSHEPLPGVELGEISTRFAHEVADNGYLKLTNVRIPRNHMLMKLAYVDENGSFQRLGDPRLLYGAMLATRVSLSGFFSVLLAKSVTIAMRYSAVRRQGLNPSGKEMLILDYPLQQYKLVPCLATTYSFYCSFMKLETMRLTILAGETIQFDRLPELHALSSGLKAFTSSLAERQSQLCRACCGGHGYLFASGIKNLNNMLDAGCTYEGDNYVLFQQTARFLIKLVQQTTENDEIDRSTSIAYLFSREAPPKSINNLDDYCRLFECRSQKLVKSMALRLTGLTGSSYDIFMQNSIELVQIAQTYSEVFVVRSLYETIERARRTETSVVLVLEQLFEVLAIYLMRNGASDFIRLGLLSPDEIHQLEMKKLPQIFSLLRPNLIGLVDAFSFHDNELDSCLGRYDGEVYEALMERARLNPTNRHRVHPVWKSIKQAEKSKL